MLRHYIKLLSISAITALTSCSSMHSDKIFYDRDKEYLQATAVEPLKIPPGLASSKFEAHYPLAENNSPKRLQTVDLTPPELV